MKSRYASRIVTRMFWGQLGCVKDVSDDFKASKRIFWRVCASWRPHWVDQYQSLTGSVVINLDWRYENVDFGASKMKSRYDSRVVTWMFLGQLRYFKHVFNNFEASKRILSTSLHVNDMKTNYLGQNHTFTESVTNNPVWRFENGDFWGFKNEVKIWF